MASGTSVRQAAVAYRPDVDRQTVDARLETAAASDGLAAFTRAEQPSNAALQEDVSGFAELSVLFPVLFLGAAGMALSVMLTRLVYSQRPLIGLLRASGASRRSIFGRYLAHGLGVAIVGGVPGIALGAVLAGAVSRLYTDAISVPVTVIRTRPSTAVAGLLFAVVAGVLASLGASLRASRIEPAVAMRGEMPPSGVGGRSIVERIVPAVSRLPVRWLMVIRGIGRNRRRTVSTMIGIVLALVLVLASWGMIDTTQVLLDQQFVQVQRQDAEVVVADGADATGALLAVDGVAAAEAVEGLDVVASTADGRYATRLRAFPTDTSMHRFLDAHGDPLSLGDGVLAGEALRDVLAVGVGDEIAVAPAGGNGSVRLRVDGFVSEPLGTPLYVSDAVFAALPWADGATTSYDVRFADGADRQQVLDRITALDRVVAVVDSKALYETARSFMGLFYAFVGVMLVFGGIMAFALIASAVSANVSEREVELATLAASGTGRAGLSRLVAGENLGLTILAIPIGVAAGIGLSSVFMSSFSSDLFRFDLHMRVMTPVYASIGILVAAVLALLPSLRVVRRLDVPEIVRRRAL
jgi:putative ABC transport system permease protein